MESKVGLIIADTFPETFLSKAKDNIFTRSMKVLPSLCSSCTVTNVTFLQM